MAFTYDQDPSDSNTEAVRFLIGDTDSAEPLLQDAEIDFAIAETSNLKAAAAMACRAIAGKLSRHVDTTVESVRVAGSQKPQHFLSLAARYERDAALATGIGVPELTGVSESTMDSVEQDSDRVESRFKRDTFDYDTRSDDSNEWE